jgi:hemoglobin
MHSRFWRSTGAAVIVALVTVSGLAAAAAAADGSLYERLGGQPAVRAVTDGLVDRIVLDTRVNKWFAHAASSPENTAAYKAKLYDFVCQATGGPCQYAGRDMVAVHKGRAVTSEAFDAVVQDLLAVLDTLKVPEKEKGQLLGILGPLKASIVQK